MFSRYIKGLEDVIQIKTRVSEIQSKAIIREGSSMSCLHKYRHLLRSGQRGVKDLQDSSVARNCRPQGMAQSDFIIRLLVLPGCLSTLLTLILK